ncbi:MAG: hypothetical protein JXA33_26025 [Anaerolineae bacterium]|nr:hypothetical protein [Anaerolineae bacterium]
MSPSDYDISDAPEIEPIPDVPDVPVDVQADFELETQYQIQEAGAALQNIDNLDVDTWGTLGAQERLDVLQDIENNMADIQGRPEVGVEMTEMDPYTFGGYNGESIEVNTSHLESNELPMSEFIDTIVHEGRHAYQDYAIQHPGFVSDTEVVNEWAENSENYLTADEYGYEAYASQPLEVDASEYAGQVVSAFMLS